MWMDDGSGEYTQDGRSMYVDALDALISAYIEARPWIDRTRVYIGGCSNGGFMTMKMLIHTPDRYAAGLPICEALRDDWITDAQIAAISEKADLDDARRRGRHRAARDARAADV